MAVNLNKGEGISLEKNENELSVLTIGLGWDVAEQKRGFLGFGKKEEDYDLDAIAFLLNENCKLKLKKDSTGKLDLIGGDIIFYNNMKHPSGEIWLTGDNRTGEGEGDDEQIIVNVKRLPKIYSKVVFLATIYEGIEKGQNFSKISNAFIRACNEQNEELARFDLSGDAKFSNCHSMVFAELERKNNLWNLTAIGKPYQTDNFLNISADYV